VHRIGLALAAGLFIPLVLLGQSAPPRVVSDAYRAEFLLNAERIIAAADDMPADRYTFRPTPGQMSFAEVVLHVLEGNDDIGAVVGDTSAPTRHPVHASDSKEVLVTRLRASFDFDRSALARLNDSRLADAVPDYGTRAAALFNTINHWSDHYSQMAIYLRLNGVLPPTARGGGKSPTSEADSGKNAPNECAAQTAGGGDASHRHPMRLPATPDAMHQVGVTQISPMACRQ
jgi:uncharacterized damage-inducible protein DinB